jgi:hypothetical protein
VTSLELRCDRHPAPRGLPWWCVGSLGLNAVLLARLVLSVGVLGTEPPALIRPSRGDQGALAVVGGPATNAATAAPGPTAFRWSEVESTDYLQYVANLRMIGCPEETIRDIICADLTGSYSERAGAILKRQPREYWQKPRNEQPSVADREKLIALGKEQESAVKSLLGVSWRQQEFVDLVYLQLHGTEQEVLFLPADRHEAAMQALAESGYDEKEAKAMLDGSGWDKREELFREKLQALATVLSPWELDEYRMRASPDAERLRTEVQYFDCTADEFKTVLEDREKSQIEKSAWGNLIDRSAATEQVRRLFGDERAEEFTRVSDLVYINARRATEDNSLSSEVANQVWEIWRDVRERSEGLARTGGLTPEELRNQLSILAQKADKGISDLMGSEASRGVRRDVKNLLRTYGTQIKK